MKGGFEIILPVIAGMLSIAVNVPAQHAEHPQKPVQTQAQHEGHKPQPPSKPDRKPDSQHQQHQQTRQTAETTHDASKHDRTGHDMSSMMNTVTGGPFMSMHAIGSGTSLLPASTPGHMWMWMKSDWMLMLHTEVKAGFNHQGGPRGVNKAESQNWFMLMAERPAGGGRLMLRGMVSAEGLTAASGVFPQLFQTGETFKGRPVVDAQHPHDLFMELAASYTLPLSERLSLTVYGGPVGEPALGPVAFMHRSSASENPAAPLSHHLQDSTHIAHGVFTTGVTAWRFRVEGSIFRGAEPDENRATIDLGKLDSYSGRITFTPTPNWAMQISHGRLINPEAAEPGNITRTTASVSHNRAWDDGNLATTLVWGRNREETRILNGYLLESTINFRDRNYLYTRMELLDREDDLLEENIFGRQGLVPAGDGEQGAEFEPTFRVAAFTFGGVRDVVAHSKFRLGIGGDVTFYRVPDELKPIYGSSPTSFHVFVRFRPGRMSH
jgi:hypothetical protein